MDRHTNGFARYIITDVNHVYEGSKEIYHGGQSYGTTSIVFKTTLRL